MRRRLLPYCEGLQPKRAAASLEPRLCNAQLKSQSMLRCTINRAMSNFEEIGRRRSPPDRGARVGSVSGRRSRPYWGHRGVFPKSYAKDICSRARVRYRSLCRLAVSAVAWLNRLRGMSSLLWEFVGVGFDDDLDGFVAGVDFDPHGTVSKIDFVPST